MRYEEEFVDLVLTLVFLVFQKEENACSFQAETHQPSRAIHLLYKVQRATFMRERKLFASQIKRVILV